MATRGKLSQLLKPQLLTERPRFQRIFVYIAVFLMTMIATLTREFLMPALGYFSPTNIFLLPVVISSWYAGPIPGLLAMFLGAASALFFFMEPMGQFKIPPTPALTALGIYLVIAFTVSLLAGHLHRALKNSSRAFLEARDALEQLGKSERRIKSLVDNIIDGVISVDQTGKINSWNPAARKIFGYNNSHVIGKNLSLLIPGSSLTNRTLQLSSKTIVPLGTVTEAVGRRKDDSYFPVELSMSEFTLGGEYYYTAIVRDITERFHTEKELIVAKEDAEAASQAKSQFIANISHEIRTPLGVIIGFTDLAMSEGIGEEERRLYMETISRNSRHLAVLIDELLDLSKIEAGRIQIEKVEFSILDLIEDLQSVLSIKAREKGLLFIITSEGPVPINIHSDHVRVRQILLNIVGNAIKFTEFGEVRLTIRCLKPADLMAPIMMQFEIKDTGIGLTREQQRRLFQPFEQADPTLARKFGGTGLGLVISRRFAQALGGDLTLVQSEPGKGSTFLVSLLNGPAKNAIFRYIPARVYEGGELTITNALPPLEKKADGKTNDQELTGLKILLVEDSADNRVMLTRFLKKAGAQVETAVNGLEGINKARDVSPDVVLMDLQMPELDGYSATSNLRKTGFSKPIIALTAHAMREERNKALKVGFNEYLTKPVNRNDLLESIRKLAAKKLEADINV